MPLTTLAIWCLQPFIANAVDSIFAASEILQLNQTFLADLDSTLTNQQPFSPAGSTASTFHRNIAAL
jgi:hypothetical protein